MYVEYVRATNTSVFMSTVLTNNIAYTIQCIACFDFCVNSVNKNIAYTIHNSIALIFCIDCLDVSFKITSK